MKDDEPAEENQKNALVPKRLLGRPPRRDCRCRPRCFRQHAAMNLRTPWLACAALVLSTALGAALAAEKYRVGDTFASFTTKDQHDRSYTFEPGVRLVIVAFEMGAGKAANAFLEKQPAEFLAAQKAIFISNIHGMPGIGRVFALPKMKKYPHRILLADAADFLVRYPAQEDQLTVLTLDERGTITAIRQVNPKKDMASIFGAAK